MERQGKVIDIRNNMICVSFCREDACAGCKGCQNGNRNMLIWLKGDASVGDRVLVEMPEKIVAKASFLAYIMPLMLFLVGLMLGNVIFTNSVIAMCIGALLGILVSFLLLMISERKRKKEPEWSPVLLRIMSIGGE